MNSKNKAPKKIFLSSEYLLKRHEVELVNVASSKDLIRDTSLSRADNKTNQKRPTLRRIR